LFQQRHFRLAETCCFAAGEVFLTVLLSTSLRPGKSVCTSILPVAYVASCGAEIDVWMVVFRRNTTILTITAKKEVERW
jgi:hypothetical protein